MQEVIISFYHCPVSLMVIEQECGQIKYQKIKENNENDINAYANFTNNFNLYLKIGEDIPLTVVEDYLDRESGKLFGIITEDSETCGKMAAIISKEQFEQLNLQYKQQNLIKILS